MRHLFLLTNIATKILPSIFTFASVHHEPTKKVFIFKFCQSAGCQKRHNIYFLICFQNCSSKRFVRADLNRILLMWWQWRAEVSWCPGRLLVCMPPYQILALSSGLWWSLLLDMHCLWRYNMTSYSCLQTNVLTKFVDTTCILFYTHSPYSLL